MPPHLSTSLLAALFFLLTSGCGKPDSPSTPAPTTPTKAHPSADLIRSILEGDDPSDQIPFASVVHATTGKRILPVDPKDAVCTEILNALRLATDSTLAKLNAPDSPVRGLDRINEASRFFEDELLALLDSTPGFSCSIPKCADGSTQRSGYPDLRLVHSASGRVTYLDPKLLESTGKESSLRTFYFEPKGPTNKILDDAHHILVGIEHDGTDGAWQFLAWHALDLSKFHVRLKAEFQASNRDLYTPELTILQGGKSTPEKE